MLPGRSPVAAVAGDYLEPLIELWRAIQSRPSEIADHYETIWKLRQDHGHTVYYEVRDRFNATKSPEDLMVLSRMCVNGLIRFNKKGDFNNSLHHTRPGIAPRRLREILQTWSRHLSGVRFQATDYEITLAQASEGDLAFLDPPYIKTRGRYRPDNFDFERLWSVLEKLNQAGVHWILTLDGSSGDRAYHQKGDVPSRLWRHALTVNTGNSPFTRLMGTSLDVVRERVYLNFDPAGVSLAALGGEG